MSNNMLKHDNVIEAILNDKIILLISHCITESIKLVIEKTIN